jgi:hypothetical protein
VFYNKLDHWNRSSVGAFEKFMHAGSYVQYEWSVDRGCDISINCKAWSEAEYPIYRVKRRGSAMIDCLIQKIKDYR